jgi:hypothetical protein
MHVRRVPFGLQSVGHLRVHRIFAPLAQIIEFTARFIRIDGVVLVDLEAGKKEIYAANGHLLHPTLLIVDRNAQSIVNGGFIECYDPLPHKRLSGMGGQGDEFDLDKQALAALEVDGHWKGTGSEFARMQDG